jgi:hypothetical protein
VSRPIPIAANALTNDELAARFEKADFIIAPGELGRWSEAGVPTDPFATLKRREAAAALTRIGWPVAYRTLNTLACRGKGPPYKLFGARSLYTWIDLLKWAEGRSSGARTTAIEGKIFAERRARDKALTATREAKRLVTRRATAVAKRGAAIRSQGPLRGNGQTILNQQGQGRWTAADRQGERQSQSPSQGCPPADAG